MNSSPGTDSRTCNDATIVRAPWAQGLLLGMLCAGAFATGIRGGFVMDDAHAITGHPVVQGTAPLLDAFKLSFWGESLSATPPSYRPIATLSFAIDHQLFGGSALAFHISSLLCYVALVLVGWMFARRCMPPWAAWLAMAFFAVMPTHAENVSSLVGRADTLAVLFSVLALLALSPTVVDGKGTLRIAGVVEAEMAPFTGPGGTVTTLRDSIFSTVPGSPAYVGKASKNRVTLPQHNMVWEYEGRNAIQSDYRMEYYG